MKGKIKTGFLYAGFIIVVIALLILRALFSPSPQCEGMPRIDLEQATSLGVQKIYERVGSRIGYTSIEEFVNSGQVVVEAKRINPLERMVAVDGARGSFIIIVDYLDYPNEVNDHTRVSYAVVNSCGTNITLGGV